MTHNVDDDDDDDDDDAGATAARTATTETSRRYMTLTLLRGALVSLGVTLFAGLVGVLYYMPWAPDVLGANGLNLPILRPIHTTFASAWIFLGGLAVVSRFMQDEGGPLRVGERWLMRVQVSSWLLAGAGILLTLVLGISTGREYMGFHPLFSILILLGWCCFAINFFRVTARGFMSRPIYVTMWGVGTLFFMFTFVEQHVYLLPSVFADPVVDLRIQWKACGTLVGSFNLFVYGSLYFIAEKVSGDKEYAHSKLAYALFAVGLINSFTNFGHHTYHLPQSPLVNWISFLISMAEIILVVKVLQDLVGMVQKRARAQFQMTRFFLTATKWWTGAMLVSSVLLSLPPLNTLVHGTHVITGHAMGAEIGIDSMTLFAAVSFLIAEMLARRSLPAEILASRTLKIGALGFNLAAATLVIWLHISGSTVGYYRYLQELPPEWLPAVTPYVFMIAGGATVLFVLMILRTWLPIVFGRGGAGPSIASPKTEIRDSQVAGRPAAPVT